MLPEVEAYFNAMDEANDNYNRNYSACRTEFPLPTPIYVSSPEDRQAYETQRNKLFETQKKISVAHESAKRAIAAELAKSENPTVRFLATTAMKEYPDHAETVLRMLPLSREELERVGPENDWCPEFGRLYALAEEQGALPPYANPANNFQTAELADAIRYNYGGLTMQIRVLLREHLPAIFAAYFETLDLTDMITEFYQKDGELMREEFEETIRRHLLKNVTPNASS